MTTADDNAADCVLEVIARRGDIGIFAARKIAVELAHLVDHRERGRAFLESDHASDEVGRLNPGQINRAWPILPLHGVLFTPALIVSVAGILEAIRQLMTPPERTKRPIAFVIPKEK